MKQTAKTPPALLLRWAEERIGAVAAVRDASHDRDRSRVWELEGVGGVSWYLKVSPSEKFYMRESRAYRHVVPALGHARAPQLVDSQARDLVMLLTAVPGAPAKRLGLGIVEWRAVHRQAGVLCARLHEAGELESADRGEAAASLDAAAGGAEKYLARAGDRLSRTSGS
ncbi:aminoglycoside phosphotransferase [Streptomyces sp. NPDC059382]|uniref:aminoglycoside phosphotransferase n=1 Tax=Streptomyces sp. NPDC059382 TaxID=3346816 RepID=UPI0036D17D74